MHEIVQELTQFRIQMKLYHWKTSFFSRHIGSDDFLEEFDKLTDKFVEVLSGSRNEKVNDKFTIKLSKLSDTTIKEYILGFRVWLCDTLPTLLMPQETDLLNLRDEMLANVNRLLYVFELR